MPNYLDTTCFPSRSSLPHFFLSLSPSYLSSSEAFWKVSIALCLKRTVPWPLASKYTPTSNWSALWWRCLTPVEVQTTWTCWNTGGGGGRGRERREGEGLESWHFGKKEKQLLGGKYFMQKWKLTHKFVLQVSCGISISISCLHNTYTYTLCHHYIMFSATSLHDVMTVTIPQKPDLIVRHSSCFILLNLLPTLNTSHTNWQSHS